MVSKKRGNKLGFWFFRVATALFGLSAAYGLLYFVCLYYLIFDPTAVSAAKAYIKKRFKEHNLWSGTLGVYRLFINQGKCLIDRYYIISGHGSFDMQLLGYDKISRLLEKSNKGIILLTAHVGNWQVTMTALEKMNKSVHLLMRPEDNEAVKDALNIDGESSKIKLISSEGFLGGVVESINAINRGELVSIMADRSYNANTAEVNFLGSPVNFPYGAFSIAASVGCPVVVLLSAKVSINKYLVEFSNIIEPKYSSKDRKQEDLKGWVQEFANILEDFVEKYPFQWFVFNDIWKQKDNVKNVKNDNQNSMNENKL